MQNFQAPGPRIGAAPPPWSPKTAENQTPSAGFWGYLFKIRVDFARFQGVLLACFWPSEPKSAPIAGWQSNELTEK
jgi:hypothetical protein